MSFFVVDFNLENELDNEVSLLLCNVSGIPLAKYLLQGNSGHEIISTRNLNGGIYLCKFTVNSKEKQVIKLSVVK